MLKIKKRTITVSVGIILLLISSVQKSIPANNTVLSKKLTKHIIVDAGHGFPDGGAVGIGGTIESTVNLKIAKMLSEKLTKLGYKVTLTRSTENALTDEGKSIAQKKKNDMYQRLEIINKSDADMFVSIHMNTFTDSTNQGAQVIYSPNSMHSGLIAEKIQNSLCKIPENKAKRSIQKGSERIFLLRNATIPAVIIECGFISNFEEEKRLNNENYQIKLAAAITKGINNYYQSFKKGN